uniref:C2H2-type domain-containing protein n=1 Tax=Strongyloides papillosus TaxID=174720 RepID=A0A0N5BC01_STREA
MPDCYFKDGYVLDKDDPNEKNIISPCKNSSTSVKSFEEFVNDNVPDNLYGANDIIDLVLCRGAGLLDGSVEAIEKLKDKGICEMHIDELYKNWESAKYKKKVIYNKKCDKKKGITTFACVLRSKDEKCISHSTNKSYYPVEKKHAVIYKVSYEKMPFLGSPLCKYHYDLYTTKYEIVLNSVTSSENAINEKEEQECKYGNMNLRTRKIEKENETPETEITRDASESTDIRSEVLLSIGTELYSPSTNNLYDSFSSSHSKDSSKVRNLLKEVFREWNIDLHFAIKESDNYNDQYFDRKITYLYVFITKLTKELFMNQEEDALIALAERFKPKFNFDEQRNKFLDVFEHHYRGNEENPIVRNAVVSIFSSIFTFKDLESRVGNLTRYQFHIGKRINLDPSLNVPKEKRIIQRVPDNKIEQFINFLTSPTVSTVLPYKEKNIKYKDGKIKIGAVILNYPKKELVDLYRKYCTDRNIDVGISDSTMFKIINCCNLKFETPKICVDYIKQAVEDSLFKILDKIKDIPDNVLLKSESADIKTFLKFVKKYVFNEFQYSITLENIPSLYSVVYALKEFDKKKIKERLTFISSKNNSLMVSGIQYYMNEFQRKIHNFQKELEGSKIDKESLNIMLEVTRNLEMLELYFNELNLNILNYQAHAIRIYHSETVKKEILSNMENNSCIVIVDWAQKLLPFKRLETQAEYFGKRGISWHLSHVIGKINSSTVQHSFVHIINNDTKQDSACILALFYNLISELKQFGIKKLIIRSDNAACYKSNETICSIPLIAKNLNVTISEYCFSETQFGKSHADRVCSLMKRRINSAAMRQDIETPRDLYIALTNGHNQSDNNPYSITLLDTLGFKSQIPQLKIDNIKRYFNFQYVGRKVYASEFKNISNPKEYTIAGSTKLEFENIKILESFYVDDFNNYWKMSPNQNRNEQASSLSSSKENNGSDVDSQSDDESEDELNFEEEFTTENGFFVCPIEECTKKYMYLTGLIKHSATGNHSLKIEKSNLVEKAIESLASKTSEHAVGMSITDIESQLQQKENFNGDNSVYYMNNYKQGWARNKRKDHTKCKKEILEVIKDLFIKSNKNEIPKLRPKEVYKYLVEAKTDNGARYKYEIKDIPNESYIKSKFSTLLRNLKIKEENKTKTKRPRLGEIDSSDSNDSDVSTDVDEYPLRVQPRRSVNEK